MMAMRNLSVFTLPHANSVLFEKIPFRQNSKKGGVSANRIFPLPESCDRPGLTFGIGWLW